MERNPELGIMQSSFRPALRRETLSIGKGEVDVLNSARILSFGGNQTGRRLELWSFVAGFNRQFCWNGGYPFEAVQVQQVQVTPQAKPNFAVVCPHCDARGPWAHTKDLAIRFWNDGYPATRAAVRRNSAPTEIRTRKPGRPRKDSEKCDS
jgi:hypothetical protein